MKILKSCTEAFILAGGASRRMGTDKSQLHIHGQTFTERLAETLLNVTDSVTIVGHNGIPDPCRQRATEMIETGHRRPLDLLERVNTRWVPFAELRNLDQAERFFVNINTPEDYDALTT